MVTEAGVDRRLGKGGRMEALWAPRHDLKTQCLLCAYDGQNYIDINITI